MTAPEGMAELAAAVRQHQLADRISPLVLRCHGTVIDALPAGSMSLVPPPALRPGQGASYRQVGVAVLADLPAGSWQLLDGGTVVAAGVLGGTAWEGTGPDGETVRVIDTGQEEPG